MPDQTDRSDGARPVSASLGPSACFPRATFPFYRVVRLTAGPDFETRTREALLLAKPGTIIEFPAAASSSPTS